MASPVWVARVVRFGSFELDLHAGELRKNGIKLRLQGRPVQLLGILTQSAGTLVTREELRAQLWSVDTFVDFDHGLHNAIARIREALGDSADEPQYVETLPRRGYRFIAPVEETADPQNEIEAPAEEKVALTPPANSVRYRWWYLAAAALATALVVGTCWPEQATTPIRSIAVLPLQNMSGDPSQEFFADGMTEELITELSHIPALKVISHTSVAEYKGTRKHLPEIARELGADAIVEGSIVREADHVRVTVQLLDGHHDRHLWSEGYDRPLHSVLTLQREVATAIAGQIRVKLTADPSYRRSSAGSVDPEAYEAYLRGRYFVTSGYSSKTSLNEAKTNFEQALQREPAFAEAHASLAEAYINMGFYRVLSPSDAYRAARAELERALALDEGLGNARTGMALLHWQFEWNWGDAEREFNEALLMAPSFDCLHAYRSNFLAWQGKREEAAAELNKARELNPGSSFAASESAIYFQLRDFPRLAEVSRRGVASDPNGWLEHYFLGMAYEGLHRPSEAIPEFEKSVTISNQDQDAMTALAFAYADSGRRDEALRILEELSARAGTSYVSPYLLATVYAGLGNKERAWELLGKAYEERSMDMIWNLKADVRLDSLRDDRRFAELEKKTGMPGRDGESHGSASVVSAPGQKTLAILRNF